MLEPIKHILQTQRIILASNSPRRREVLQNIGLMFEVVPSLYDESNLDPKTYAKPADFVVDTALHKVQEVAERLKGDAKTPDLIIGADTVVVFEGKIHGKPTSEENAFEMLKKFSGGVNYVYTGVVLNKGGETVKFHEMTEVHMGSLTPEMIMAYIKTGEPMDKAGGYGIQGIGGTLVKTVIGDYFNIVGFPLYHFCAEVYKLFSSQNLESTNCNS